MTSNASPGSRVLGRLGVADGTGVVRVEDRYDTDIDDLWSSITDPERLARWYGKVEGDLRPGGAFTVYLESADLEGIGRVDTCEPPRRLQITTRESDESRATRQRPTTLRGNPRSHTHRRRPTHRPDHRDPRPAPRQDRVLRRWLANPRREPRRLHRPPGIHQTPSPAGPNSSPPTASWPLPSAARPG